MQRTVTVFLQCCVMLLTIMASFISTNATAQSHPECSANAIAEDIDGDGYGWENNATCVYDSNIAVISNSNNSGPASCSASAIAEDIDGDGYGWENNATCLYDPIIFFSTSTDNSGTDSSVTDNLSLIHI